jgi:hypothetical protein
VDEVPEAVCRLEEAEIRSLVHLPSDPMKRGRPGVYTIWYGSRFLYVGMAYVDSRETKNPPARGV